MSVAESGSKTSTVFKRNKPRGHHSQPQEQIVLYLWDIRFVLIALDSGLKTAIFCNDSENIFM